MSGLGRAALLAVVMAAVAAGAQVDSARAQQYFNGAQTTPNGAINGGGGVWNDTTTNWTNDPGTTSTAYDPSPLTTTIFGASATSTPTTGGTVTVAPGGVTLTGAVVFGLTGDNSIYTIHGGNLTVASGGTTFSVADVSNTGGVAPSAIINSNIVGAGGINVQGAGILGSGPLVLNGTNTYAGGTTICNCATLQLGDATHTGSIVGVVDNGGGFNIVNANTAGITTLTNDFGITTFFGANTAATMTINNINGGETDFGVAFGTDTASAGSATIVNRTGGTTVFNAASTAANANITNRYSGETDFYDNSKAGNATILNRYFGVTTFNDSSSAENANITNRYGGLTFFFDNSTAANATIVNNSPGLGFGPPAGLAFLDNSTAGNATVTTNNNAVTAFFDNSTGGNARFITNDTGIVDFSGSTGPNGDGRISAGSIEGSGNYFIGGGNTLVVGSNNRSTEVSGVIADSCGCGPGPGSLEKVGSGTLILSGTNTYTGTTTVNGGVLQVDGVNDLSSLTTVNAGGALTGIGTIGNALIAGGGIYAPGSGTAGSSQIVNGNLAFQSGALYLVALNSVTASFANVAGNALLDGTVVAAFVPGSTVLPQYTIMQVGSHSGNFAGVAAPGGLVGTITSDPNNIYLNFALDWSAKYNLNINQRNVASTLQNFWNINGTIPAAFAGLSPGGLTQVSGELATGTQQATFDAMNLFVGLLTDPFVIGRNGGAGGNAGAVPFADETSLAYAGRKSGAARDALAKFPTKADVARNDLLDNRWSVWGAAFGGGNNTDGNAAVGSNAATVRAFGFAAGADFRISRQTLVGFAFAGGGTNFSVLATGSGRSDMFQAGAFIRHNAGPAYVTAAAAWAWQDVTTDRTVTAAGFEQLRAQFNANAITGRIEGGYRYVTPWMGVTPYAAGQFTSYFLPAYAEQVLAGPGNFALNYAARDVTAGRTELGVRLDKSYAMQSAILTLRGRLAWAHDFFTDRSITPVFQTLPGTSFIVYGAAQPHDSALTTASAEMKWLNGWSAAGTFEGQFSDVNRSYAGKGVLRYAW
ncbi:autotransporter domain-containing protein [Bradyrhizobium sp.]|uniref:autotransporter outer membrane beta-barrel domain-containing protein n=1 Tax=Bradyrhizobium sp. TaxID=376 RepID=UPI0025BBC8C6|nr:autotransporter domain-containing protein [Bradyrhizobium sp.]